jgi:putative spermidine/putrescine transport system ATP-binding protein
MSQVDTNAGASDVLVSFRGVQKSYDGENLIVKDLNLDIRKGEFLTLLGPSGSGKTTSLMMLAGFETPTAGEILLAGRSINNVPPHKRDIGMVFQNYALFPHMTVAENLAFPLTVRGLNKSDVSDRVKKVLSMVQLDAFASRYPAQLSGGQQQRVALARALVFEPQLVLMDEPLGALDKQLREHMQMEIKHLHQRLGVTVVYVTHDQGEALTMSDRVAVFHQGEIQQIAAPRSLYEEPKNTFVANFIGENNRLNGRLLSQTRRALRGRVGPWGKGRGAGGQCRPDRRTGDAVDPSGAREPQRFERVNALTASQGGWRNSSIWATTSGCAWKSVARPTSS